jgi:type I restriction enzyme R subunit
MMKNINYTEDNLENATLEWLKELGYLVAFGPDIAFDGSTPERNEKENYKDIILLERLKNTIAKINPEIPVEARQDAIDKVVSVPWLKPSLIEVNKVFHKMVFEGVDVAYKDNDGILRNDKVKLFDFENAENNDFLAVNQFTIIENRNRRPDILIFVNGMPLAIFELKNPADSNATNLDAFNQLQTYKTDIPSLFAYNEISVISDHIWNSFVGTIFSDKDRFMGWKSVDGKEFVKRDDMETLVKGIFQKEIFLDLIKNFIVFESDGEKIIKKIAGYHQYFATNKAIERTITATSENGDRRAGVVWHTQGSGKSLTMVFFAGKIIQVLDNPTLVLLTDRNDLDGQLFDLFARCSDVIRQNPVQAESREHLKKILSVASGGVVFTTIQKFMPENKGDIHPLLSDRKNIVVLTDEAHRSQYDFIDGFARNMRDALPNASFIGFTGTPIELSDANTRAVFGEYVDVYDIVRSVEDKATVPIYYEPRLAKIQLLKEATPKIDQEFEELTEGEETTKKDKLKSKWAKLEAMIGSEKRIKLVAQDVVDHFENRSSALDGKGMFVSMSRRIAVEMYDEIIKLRPQWHNDDINKGFIKVVMTGSASDPQNYQRHIHTKEQRDLIAKRMKDNNDELKFVIVRDMWLTGFDVPSLHTMYVDKPMKGHGLMQAIARVNRVFKNKPGGLIVDYLGIAPMLKEAMANYTNAGQTEPMIDQEKAVSVMLSKFEVVKDMYHGFDYYGYVKANQSARAKILSGAMDYILNDPDGKQKYSKAVAELSAVFALAVPNLKALEIRDDVGFFQAVKSFIQKFDAVGGFGGPTNEDYDQAIKQLVSEAVVSDKVINIFDAAGIKSPNISVLSDEFLNEVKGLEHKNVALEILKKILNDEIRTMERKFLTKAKVFSKMLEETIKRYQNQTIESAQVIAELVELAKKLREEKERGVNLNLSDDETAFYDALCDNESAVMDLGDETLKTIARELVIMLRKNTSIDWTLKQNVQAKLRVLVKKLLNRYKYPPDKQETATKTVLEQAEVLCRDWSGDIK